MTPEIQQALTKDIKASTILQYENWWIMMMRRRGNRTAFYLTIGALMLLLLISTTFGYPLLAFGWFMAATSIVGGIEERSWAKKYNLSLQEVTNLIGTIYPGSN